MLTLPIIIFIASLVILIIFSEMKFINLSVIVAASIFIIILSFKQYDTLSDDEFWSIIILRYTLLYIILIFSAADVIFSYTITDYYDKVGVYLFSLSEWNFWPILGGSLVGSFLLGLLFDGLLPAIFYEGFYTSFKFFGVFSIVIVSIAGINLIRSVYKTVKAYL